MDPRQMIKFDLMQTLINLEAQGYYILHLQVGEKDGVKKIEIEFAKITFTEGEPV